MNIIITAGGTSEKIDNKRKIVNIDSGKYGALLAAALCDLDNVEKIMYVSPQKSIKPKKNDKIVFYDIESVKDVCNTIEDILSSNSVEYIVHTMSVGDHMLEYVASTEKIALELACMSSAESANNQMLVKVIKDTITQLETPHDIINEKNEEEMKNTDLIIRMVPSPNIPALIKEKSPDTKIIGYMNANETKHEDMIDNVSNEFDKNSYESIIVENIVDGAPKENYAFVMQGDRTVKEVKNRQGSIDFIKEKIKN